MVPLLVGGAAWLYERRVWIPPEQLLFVIAKQQFAPLLTGIALLHFAPTLCEQLRRPLIIAGNVLFLVAVILLLVEMGHALIEGGAWIFFAAFLLAAGCMTASLLLVTNRTAETRTLVISNVNRHAGLALLLSGRYFDDPHALPVILAYALEAPLVMWLYAKYMQQRAVRVGTASA